MTPATVRALTPALLLLAAGAAGAEEERWGRQRQEMVREIEANARETRLRVGKDTLILRQLCQQSMVG